MIEILLNIQSKKREVIDFLKELKEIPENDTFDINKIFTLISKKKPNDEKHGKEQINQKSSYGLSVM